MAASLLTNPDDIDVSLEDDDGADGAGDDDEAQWEAASSDSDAAQDS